jgi:hypothetical protein
VLSPVELIGPNYQILAQAAFPSKLATFLEHPMQQVDHPSDSMKSISFLFSEPLKELNPRFISPLLYSHQIRDLPFSRPGIEICMELLLKVIPIGNRIDCQ